MEFPMGTECVLKSGRRINLSGLPRTHDYFDEIWVTLKAMYNLSTDEIKELIRHIFY